MICRCCGQNLCNVCGYPIPKPITLPKELQLLNNILYLMRTNANPKQIKSLKDELDKMLD